MKLKVFVNSAGEFGNPLEVTTDTEQKLTGEMRQNIARNSGLSEVVFINRLELPTPDISIFSQSREIKFAGHAVIGAIWALEKLLIHKIVTVKCQEKIIKITHAQGKIFVQADLTTLPEWNFLQLQSPGAVEQLTLEQTKDYLHSFVWAWQDQKEGLVRARTFARDRLIPEDEANGSGSILLTAQLKQNLQIIHGKGSLIFTDYLDQQNIKLSGWVREEIY